MDAELKQKLETIRSQDKGNKKARAQFDKFYAEACSAEAQNNFAEAAQIFTQAAGLDASVAELQFRWGECLLQLSNDAAAREHLERACTQSNCSGTLSLSSVICVCPTAMF